MAKMKTSSMDHASDAEMCCGRGRHTIGYQAANVNEQARLILNELNQCPFSEGGVCLRKKHLVFEGGVDSVETN